MISAADVNNLRKRTNAALMDCKAALVAADGDMEKAVEELRKKNSAIKVRKADRETAEGRIGAFVDPEKKVGALVELRCESAPSAKNELFIQLANDLARQVALHGAESADALLAQPFVGNPVQTISDRINEVVGLIRENMKPARMQRLHGLTGSYVHHDGSVGVLLQVEGDRADPQMLRDVCMHITAKNPAYALAEDVPPATLDKEREIALSQLEADPKNKKKPADILKKIVEGKLKTFVAENVLTEQPFVKDETKTVGQLLQSAGLKVMRFVRYKVGELS